MNRGYVRKDYIELVNKYRKIVGGRISSDVIVGFPTETQEDFNETLDLVKTLKFCVMR